jgi:AsmA protein
LPVRIAKWIGGVAAGLILLAALFVLIVTVLVDPNRFKGRIEGAVTDAAGIPFKIDGNLDIAWFPWLAVQTGRAQLGEEPLLQWSSARVGARLIPLIRGRLVVSRIRLEGFQAHLRRTPDGRANWEKLLANRDGSGNAAKQPPEFAGLEIRNGAVEYLDERDGTRVSITDWTLDLAAWRPGAPVAVDTRFVLQNGAPSAMRIPIALRAQQIQMQFAPVVFSIPAFELQLADAQVNGSLALESTQPLRASGDLSVRAASLRKLLDDLGFRGPRPRDATALGAFRLASRWTADDGAVAVGPLEIHIDQTVLGGQLGRSKEPQPIWTFNLQGDRIVLDRYTDLEQTDTEPFELPTDALRALRARGVISFSEAQLAEARMKEVRLRLELADGKLHEP